jgi:hypothetical protein
VPLTDKGREILEKMEQEYGAKKGEQVFYASANKHTITGVHDAMEQSKLDDVMATCNEYDQHDAGVDLATLSKMRKDVSSSRPPDLKPFETTTAHINRWTKSMKEWQQKRDAYQKLRDQYARENNMSTEQVIALLKGK